jgi:hypothetical protein
MIKFGKLCNITSASIESVKFDTQLMDNPNISGVEYQQGTLLGYELREYLFHKYGHNCQYCGGESKDPILEVEHMTSKHNNGSNSVKNLSIACHTCNKAKDSLNLEQWLAKLKQSKQTDLNKKRIELIEEIVTNGIVHIHKRYATWVTAYRWRLVNDLKPLIDNIELSSGGRTKFNRTTLQLPKEHYYDAVCVGKKVDNLKFKTDKVLCIKAYGRGSRFRGRTNDCGVIISYLPRQKNYFGFQTGDMVKAKVLKGKKKGSYLGRVAVRSSGYFNIQTKQETIQGIKHSYCSVIQRSDGYGYSLKDRNMQIIERREVEQGVPM